MSGNDTLVIQLRNASGAQRVFFSTAIASFTEITDSDFTGLTIRGKMEFVDGYAFVLASNNRIYNSDLNTLSSWGAASYISKQIEQTSPVCLARFGNQILAFGEENMEVFRNAGNATGSPLQSVPSMFQRIGAPRLETLGTGHYYAMLGNKMYFIGRQGKMARATGVYAYNGSAIDKVSNSAIDKILNSLPYDATNGIFSIGAVGFYGQTAIALALDPVTATTQRWLMFFPEWKDWFEWNSTVFSPVGTGTQLLGLGANQHKLYQLYNTTTPADNFQDDGNNYQWAHQFKLPGSGNQRKHMPMFSLKGDTARSALNIGVEFSDDDYQSWSAVRNIDMTGAMKFITRCGGFNDRAVRLSYTGALEVRLESVMARIN
jgi:hypothetical protein